MNDETIIPSVAAEEGPGPLLRAARERNGMSLRDIADGLNLKITVVEALEQERYEKLPPRTFVKGYFKSYAKLVGVKEYDVLAALDRSSPEQVQTPLPATARQGDADPFGGWLKWLLLLVAIVAVLVLFYKEFGDRVPLAPQPSAQETAPQQASPVAEPETSEAVPVPAESSIATGAPAEAAPAQAPPAAAAQAPVTAPAETPAPASPPVAQSTQVQAAEAPNADEQSADAQIADTEPAQSESAGAPLVLELSADSWLEVRDAAGTRLFVGTARGPRTYEFSGVPPISLVIGDATAVELRYEGETIALRPFMRGKVARLDVPLSE